jgi:hypothetical protein
VTLSLGRVAGTAEPCSRVDDLGGRTPRPEVPMRTKLVLYAWMLAMAALLTACAAGARVGPVGGGVSAF